MRPRSSRFSPRLVAPELLERLTVAHGPLLARMVGNLTAAIASGQGRFDLLVGPRGVGKSHLLALVEARVRANEQLRGRLVVVALPEEFHPSSLVHLLARVLEQLPQDHSQPPVAAQLQAVRGREASEAADMLVAMIRARLAGRSLLVMLENLDAMFRDLGRKAQARLRRIVQTERGWSIFATAHSAIALSKQTEPFHGTFVVHPLQPLAPAQCQEMLLQLARVHERAKLEAWLETDVARMHVRAAHHLVGGSPRVIAMLFHNLDPEHPDDFEGNFHRLAEELTPWFQEQMARLSAGQRPVLEFLAERWSPASVKEIAEATFNEPTTVSTHLRALRREHLVRSLAVGKERYYEIAEPLHRVARAMKHDEKLAAAIAEMARVWALLDGEQGQPTHGVQYWREALDDPSVLQDSSVRVPLWIASGRDVAALRDALQARIAEVQLPAAFEYALAAEDNSRA
ncbi:MAG TPA: ArsR family transcriptional regulator, partial [Enhygromyxa sp.]|nr:ArsR family transcriptional regulator [Enhygromyxa sp.]